LSFGSSNQQQGLSRCQNFKNAAGLIAIHTFFVTLASVPVQNGLKILYERSLFVFEIRASSTVLFVAITP
jgi:hypothetical protein